jgi:hypothetical protein
MDEEAIRKLVREVLEGHPGGAVWEPSDDSTKVSAIVDPQEDDTNPINPEYTPQDKVELGVAIKNLVKNLPDERMPDIYKHVKDAMALDQQQAQKDAEMKEKDIRRNPVEEALRREIRRHLAEARPGAAYHGMDFFGEEDPEEEDRRKYTSTVGASDNVRSQPDVASDLGISTAKLNQEEQIYRAKRGFLKDPEHGVQIMKNAQDDFIEYLQTSGELNAGDVKLLKDHPEMVEDLDGYKEFLAIYTFDDPGFAEYAAEVMRRPVEIAAAWAKRESKKLEKMYPGGWFSKN